MKHSGTKDFPGPAHSLKDNIAHIENPASGGPDSRDHSTVKPSGGIDSSIAHSSTHRTAQKSNPASGGPDTEVVCQILQMKLKRPIIKAITHQDTQVTTLQLFHQDQPPYSIRVA